MMPAPSPARTSLTIPNLITLVRIFLTPVFIMAITQAQYRWALVVFLLAGLSDLADGLIARHWQQRSPLGSFLDPLADKLLLSSSFLTLGIFHLVPAWLTVLVLSRDAALTLGVALLKLADYPLVPKPSLAGKVTTNLQIATTLAVVAAKIWGLPAPLLQLCFWLTGAFTAFSGIHYIVWGLKYVAQYQNQPGHHG